MATKRVTQKAEMNTWGSVITRQRANQMGDVIQRIEAVNTSPVNRQVGNVINDLKIRGEHRLIDALKEAIEGYNESIKEHNKRVVQMDSIRIKLDRFKKDERYWNAYQSAFPGGLWSATSDYPDPYDAIRTFEYEYSQQR